MRAVNLTPSVSRQAGGLFESVRYLAQSTAAFNGWDISVVALQDRFYSEDVGKWAPLPVSAHAVKGPKKFSYAPTLCRGLRRENPDLLHLHGLWQYPSVATLRWFRATGKPYLVSPHGMLEPWALTQSNWAKRLATLLYQRACLERASCIRATSELERESIRKAGYRNKIVVIPNGVELPQFKDSEVSGKRPSKRVALFLSRIHPKKGLLNLVRAWSKVLHELSTCEPSWTLRIVGPDERGHLAEVKAEAGRLGVAQTIEFPGEAWGELRARCYQEADLFVLPSFSENFGLVIAEALASGVPVVTTRATPWAELEDHACGWWIDTGVEPLQAALTQALSLQPPTLAQMGQRGRKLIESKYVWPAVAKQTIEVYEWMLGKRQRPLSVHE